MSIKFVDLSAIQFTDKMVANFWKRVDKQPGDGCWNWTGPLGETGYGRFSISRDGRQSIVKPHRVSLHLHGIGLPDDKVCDHVCRNRRCVRPSHLRLVTNLENLHAPGATTVNKLNLAKTKCPRGHDLDGYYMRYGKVMIRYCKTCDRGRKRQRDVSKAAP